MQGSILASALVFAIGCGLIAGEDEAQSGKIGGRGFGEEYEWRSFVSGIKEAESTSKPALVVIHKSW
jgi:hypothetical protein